ncbi:MAG: hypothetical protein NTW97_07670, partial [Candidatus Krumholzibacteria bacterium]|nr:hypothetical protein [Candidatus Krumholzibacteria bacterium]
MVDTCGDLRPRIVLWAPSGVVGSRRSRRAGARPARYDRRRRAGYDCRRGTGHDRSRGAGYDGGGSGGFLNDLWKYDPVTNQWTWLKGA